jgi:hypothetical protein
MKIIIIGYEKTEMGIIKTEKTYKEITSVTISKDKINWVLSTVNGNKVILSKKDHFIESAEKENIKMT